MKSPRSLIRPCLVAAGFLLTYPLASLAAPDGASDGNATEAPCSPPEPHAFGAPPPPGPGPGFSPGMGPHIMGPGFGPGMGMGMGMGGPGFGEPPFLAGLHLTDEQQDKVFAIVYAAEPAVHEQTKALRKAHEALHELSQSDQYDESRVKSLAEAAAKAESQLTVLRLHTEHEILALLTPDQKKQLEDHRHKARERDGGHPPA
jgi:periplasmic protein CpxP/Spy